MPDHFQRLGLSRRFSIDADELERLYLARSRELPQVFLMEMMDLREEIDNAQRAQSTSTLERLRGDLAVRFNGLLKSVGDQFGDGSREPSAEVLRQIRKEMNAAKVIRGLLRDLNDIG